jgi:Tfp pilus assembly protein PilN
MLEQYHQISEVAGIHIHIDKDGSLRIDACVISIKNKQLSFVKKLTGLTSLDALAKQLSAKALVALNLSGKGILQKQLEKADEIDQQNFTQVLPNGTISDFYIQNFISGTQSFVSIIRNTEADKWIQALTELDFQPLMLSLGPFPVQQIVPQLNVYEGDLLFNGYTITRNEQKDWLKVSYDEAVRSPFALKIESEGLNEALLIPYSAAFQLLMAERLDLIHAPAAETDNAFLQLQEERKFKFYGFLVLGVFFVLLLVNFLLFSWLNSANGRLTEQVSRSAQSTSDVQQVEDEVKQKEDLLQTLGWEEGVNKSGLIDQLASLLPQEITWKEAAVDPVNLSSSRQQKSIVFDTRRIRIIGNSEKIIPVNEWIARIKTKAWVKNVQLDSYTFNSEMNTGQFTLIIDY